MALKVFDGLDHYNTVTDMISRTGFLQYQLPGTFNPTIAFQTGRGGLGRCVKVTNNNGTAGVCALRLVWGDRNPQAFFSLGLNFPAGAGFWVYFIDGVSGSIQMSLNFNATNFSIQAFRGDTSGTSLGLTANNIWEPNVWNLFEFHPVINNSTGSIEIRKNGDTILNISGVDTQISANAWFDVVDLLSIPPSSFSTSFYLLDDVYYCDTVPDSGVSANDNFLGDVRVATVFATGNDAVQFTPLAGANWQEISEVAMDGDSSYNFDSTAGHQDTFVFQSIASVISTIYGLQITYAARKDDAGARTMAGVIRISGTSHVYGSPDTVPFSASYPYLTDLWILSPASGLNFTLSEVNAATYGYKLVT